MSCGRKAVVIIRPKQGQWFSKRGDSSDRPHYLMCSVCANGYRGFYKLLLARRVV
jgi:hypothetical protein